MSTVLPVHPAAELFPMLGPAEMRSLSQNIKSNGLRRPVVLFEGQVLDGRNRLAACEWAGVEPRFEEFTGDDPWQYAWDLNAERRHLEPMQRAALAVKFAQSSADWKREQAKRKTEADRSRGETQKDVPKAEAKERAASTEARRSPPTERKAAAAIADRAHVSRSSIERAMELQRRAPEAFEAVCRGEMPGRKALGDVKRAERMERLAEISKGDAPLPAGQTAARYPVIYADPPWEYEGGTATPNREIENQYPTMPLADICALKVAELATEDAVLFLWTTAPKLEEAFQVIRAWGFTYRTGMVWDKDRMGPGYWARQQHEHLLIAIRGEMPTPAPENRPPSLIRLPRTEHSAKPGLFAEVIERAFPDLPRIELFCRAPRAGWAAWGNQS